MELVSINEIASLMNVSVQTIRNWEELGYLKSVRTIGGHRRFNLESVKSFRDNVSKSVVVLDECTDELYRREQRVKNILGDDVRGCGGISRENMAVLIENQRTCESEDNREYANDMIFKIAEHMSSPYFFITKALFGCSEIVWYQRCRGTEENGLRFAIDGEDVGVRTWKINNYIFDDVEVRFKEIVEIIDKTNIENIINNVTVQKHSEENLDLAIYELASKKAWRGEANIIVIMPPELCKGDYKFKKINQNTKMVVDFNYDIPDLKIYVTRLIPSNKVIIANLDEKNCGYIFCPYILAFKSNLTCAIRTGSKLLRDGVKFYSVLEFGDE